MGFQAWEPTCHGKMDLNGVTPVDMTAVIILMKPDPPGHGFHEIGLQRVRHVSPFGCGASESS